MTILIESYNVDTINERQIQLLTCKFQWSNLWWSDLEEAGVENLYVASINCNIVGFMTVSIDNECVAIEVHPEFQGKGIARKLIEESECYKPERNENPEFWAAVATWD